MQHVLNYEIVQNVGYDYIRSLYLLNIYFIMLVIKNDKTNDSQTQMKWMNYGEWFSIRGNLVLKPYYEDYQGLLFYEELDKVKFSLSDQYSCYYNTFNNI